MVEQAVWFCIILSRCRPEKMKLAASAKESMELDHKGSCYVMQNDWCTLECNLVEHFSITCVTQIKSRCSAEVIIVVILSYQFLGWKSRLSYGKISLYGEVILYLSFLLWNNQWFFSLPSMKLKKMRCSINI